jgi:hypothetical protein
MPYLRLKFLFVLLGCLLLNPGARANRSNGGEADGPQDTTSVTLNHSDQRVRSSGYQAIASLGDEFIAVGSTGRIDRISISGKVQKTEQIEGENFNCVLADNQKTIVAGDHGSIYISLDKGAFRKVNSESKNNINAIALFRGLIIAGTDEGIILSGDGKNSFRKTFIPANGNIVALSATNSDCYGVTDEGEIIHTVDGVNWDVFNFNEVYAGFYKPCKFTSVLVTENRIAVAGVRNDGSPVLLFSTQGNVWTDRTLNYTDDQGSAYFPTDSPNSIYFDKDLDLFFLVFDKGKLMKIPSCSHCNKLAQVSTANLTGISGNGKTLVMVGENFNIKAVSLDWE